MHCVSLEESISAIQGHPISPS